MIEKKDLLERISENAKKHTKLVCTMILVQSNVRNLKLIKTWFFNELFF